MILNTFSNLDWFKWMGIGKFMLIHPNFIYSSVFTTYMYLRSEVIALSQSVNCCYGTPFVSVTDRKLYSIVAFSRMPETAA